MKKLYVGNLPRSVRDDDLADLFQEYGVASAKVITDRDSGQSRGFGFVEIEDDEVALRAIEEKNGVDVDGYALVVNEARPPERKPFGGGGERRCRDASSSRMRVVLPVPGPPTITRK